MSQTEKSSGFKTGSGNNALKNTSGEPKQTDLKTPGRQETALERESLKAFLQKAGTACHDLNQPLQSIMGYSDLIMMDLDESNPIYERFFKMRQQIDKLADVSRKLMSIIKDEAEQLER